MGPLDEARHFQQSGDLALSVLLLAAAVLVERQPALAGVAGPAEVGRQRVEIGEGDVGADLDRVRAQQFAQERHLHGLGLEVVDDELAHVASADAVVDRVVKPLRAAQQRCQPGLADAGHAEHGHGVTWRVMKFVRRLEQHRVFRLVGSVDAFRGSAGKAQASRQNLPPRPDSFAGWAGARPQETL